MASFRGSVSPGWIFCSYGLWSVVYATMWTELLSFLCVIFMQIICTIASFLFSVLVCLQFVCYQMFYWCTSCTLMFICEIKAIKHLYSYSVCNNGDLRPGAPLTSHSLVCSASAKGRIRAKTEWFPCKMHTQVLLLELTAKKTCYVSLPSQFASELSAENVSCVWFPIIAHPLATRCGSTSPTEAHGSRFSRPSLRHTHAHSWALAPRSHAGETPADLKHQHRELAGNDQLITGTNDHISSSPVFSWVRWFRACLHFCLC